jgi:ribosome maturation factor RimP
VTSAGTQQLREKHPVVLKVESEIERTLASHGYELVHITYGGHGRARTLTVYMDKQGGVSAADCHDMAAQISVLLDIVDPIPESYNLVVSSPGVERPLVSERDFSRFAGRSAAITFTNSEGRQTREGSLLGVDGNRVLLETEQEVLRISLDAIDKAHLLYDEDLDVDR